MTISVSSPVYPVIVTDESNISYVKPSLPVAKLTFDSLIASFTASLFSEVLLFFDIDSSSFSTSTLKLLTSD